MLLSDRIITDSLILTGTQPEHRTQEPQDSILRFHNLTILSFGANVNSQDRNAKKNQPTARSYQSTGRISDLRKLFLMQNTCTECPYQEAAPFPEQKEENKNAPRKTGKDIR